MKGSILIGEAATYELTRALLIYELKSGSSGNAAATAVTVHDISHPANHGLPVIEAGRPVTYAAVESLASALGRNLAPCFLPANVLSVGFGQVAWFCPAGRRRLWFKPDGRFDGGHLVDNSETARVLKLNGRFAQHPPLLFIGRDRSLRVFALADNSRPAADTTLYRAPYWNLWESGELCQGNRRLADLPTPASIPSYQDGFFTSAFSHTNIKRICCHPHGHAGLWQDLADRKTAPDAKYWRANLLALKKTVNQAIKDSK